MAFTDIRFDLVSRLPRDWRPYALLMRLDRPIGWWLLLLPGWWAILLAGGLTWETLVWMPLFWMGAVIMRGAGCIINDIWDLDIDRRVERTRLRPLVSGAVTKRQAFLFLGILLWLGLLILLQLTPVAIILGCLSMAFVVTYPLMKRITWWPQAFLGLTFNFGALIGWATVTGGVSGPALLLYAGGFFWTLGYDTIYAHQDKEDDELAGVKSTARLFGAHSKKWVIGFYIVSMILIAAGAHLARPDSYMVQFLIPAAGHLYWQAARWKMADPASSLKIFKSNRVFGWLVLLGIFAAQL